LVGFFYQNVALGRWHLVSQQWFRLSATWIVLISCNMLCKHHGNRWYLMLTITSWAQVGGFTIMGSLPLLNTDRPKLNFPELHSMTNITFRLSSRFLKQNSWRRFTFKKVSIPGEVSSSSWVENE
jgi:hypothetical protein